MAEIERADDLLDLKTSPGKPGGLGSGSPASRPKSRFGRFFLPSLLISIALLTLVQLAGVLLRDRLEGRTTTSPQEPVLSAIGKFAPKHHEAAEGTGRGFGVTEIPVGSIPDEAAKAPQAHGEVKPASHAGASPHETEAKHAEPVPPAKPAQPKETKQAPAKTDLKAPAKEPPPKAAAAKEAPKPAEAKIPAKTEAKAEVTKKPEPKSEAKQEAPKSAAKAPPGARFAPDPAGGYAVAVGAFNSQRLAGIVEKRLDDLGFPHTRAIIMKEADGYTLTVGAASEAVVANAAKALSDGGYRADKAGSGLALRFISKDEAEKAKAVAEKAGAEGSIKKAVGQVPLWRVLVGPTNSENARKAQETLKAEGMESVVVRFKP